jgi:nitric oxide reductase large subunit
LVFWSFPLLFGLLSMTLAIAAIRGSAPRSNSHACAVAALWILAAGLVLGMTFTLRFLY